MNDVNTVIMSGTISDDPIVRELQGGSMVIKINLETKYEYKTREGEHKEGRQFNKAVLWNNAAKLNQAHLYQGSRVMVQGSLSTDSYEKDGRRVYVKEIKVEKLTPMGASQQPQQVQQQPAAQQPQQSQGWDTPQGWGAQPAAQQQPQGWGSQQPQQAQNVAPQSSDPIPF